MNSLKYKKQYLLRKLFFFVGASGCLSQIAELKEKNKKSSEKIKDYCQCCEDVKKKLKKCQQLNKQKKLSCSLENSIGFKYLKQEIRQ